MLSMVEYCVYYFFSLYYSQKYFVINIPLLVLHFNFL